VFLAVKVVTATFAHGLFYDGDVFSTLTAVHFFLERTKTEIHKSKKAPGPGGGTDRSTYISITETFFSIYYKWNFG